MALKVLALGGDGIGPEVVDAALQILEVASKSIGLPLDISEDVLGWTAWERYGTVIRPTTLSKAHACDALLVGAVGDPKWDHIVIEGGPEDQDGLMKLRHELQVFACLRWARAHDALLKRTAFKPEVISNTDLIVMRELCGGADPALELAARHVDLETRALPCSREYHSPENISTVKLFDTRADGSTS